MCSYLFLHIAFECVIDYFYNCINTVVQQTMFGQRGYLQ